MIDKEEKRKALQAVKHCLIKAHDEIEGSADFFELHLHNEYEMANCKEYGIICQALGILEEQIANIGNQINQLK